MNINGKEVSVTAVIGSFAGLTVILVIVAAIVGFGFEIGRMLAGLING